jgi:deoxyribose-phosphate aldolase
MSNDLEIAALALRCLDLTSLKSDDTEASITALAAAANTPHGAPAALCVYPRWIATARHALDARGLQAVHVAAVVNFPHGLDHSGAVAAQTSSALDHGADEIDVVFNWQALLAGDVQPGIDVVQSARSACDACATMHGRTVLLKVILETGELRTPALIAQASIAALDAGADFIKTSTGKVPVNATPEAARLMLVAIRDHACRNGRSLAQSAGFKAAGGVTTVADARQYVALAQEILGLDWVTPEHLRFGASSLLRSLLATLRGDGQTNADATGY